MSNGLSTCKRSCGSRNPPPFCPSFLPRRMPSCCTPLAAEHYSSWQTGLRHNLSLEKTLYKFIALGLYTPCGSTGGA